MRVIADGTVIFKRDPTSPNVTAADPQNYNPYSDTPAWTDNGIVIVRHTTDIGAMGHVPTSVTYYSVYMHLSHIESAISENQVVWRKDALGTAGRIYGRDNQIHFEVCLKSSELQKLVGAGRSLTWTDPATVPAADGRIDAVFGSIYVYLPVGTPTSTVPPSKHLSRSNLIGVSSSAAGQIVPNTLQAAQWVEIRYRNGSATVSSYRAGDAASGVHVGDSIGTPHYEQDFEYDLYAKASERHASAIASGATNSSPSGWYELLRFGRNLGTDALPLDAAHWREVPSASGTLWADLNASGTRKFSDADFPGFKGWQFFDDDSSPENQKCDSMQLKRAIRDPAVPDSISVRGALGRRLGESKVRERLKRAVCKFPTEWDKSTIVQRYEWLKSDQDFMITEGKAWDEFKAHAESISFSGAPQEYKDAMWHVHPRMFISHMRLCGWLSEKEAVQLFPRTALRNAGPRGWVNEGVNPGMQVLRDNLAYLNQTTRKYCITTQRRMAAFYGNAMQETQWFGLLTEGGAANTRYAPWFGRSFLQLTWPENYIEYAAFKGISVSAQLKAQFALAYRVVQSTGNNQAYLALEVQVPAGLRALREDAKEPRQHLAPSDSAGAYWAWSAASRSADPAAAFTRASAGGITYYTQSSFGNVAATVNVGHPSTHYSSIYGVQARFQAHLASVMVLLDREQFLDAQGQMKEVPEGWVRRVP